MSKKKGDPVDTLKNFQKKSQSRKRGGGASQCRKNGNGTLRLWNGFVFRFRDFGCVQNEVLSTYCKNA